LIPKPEDLSKKHVATTPREEELSMNYKYFIHQECSFYPCHELNEWKSCLFCWCPLYLLDCGGNFKMRNDVKDCSACVIPHTADGYDFVVKTVQKQVYGKI